MENSRGKLILKSIIWGIAWFGVASIVGLVIVKLAKDKSFENILFIEGIVLIFVGIFASISGDPIGLSLQGAGQNSAQYLSNANLEITKMEREKTNRKLDIALAVSTFSLIIGGAISIIFTFII